jgi:hypothetical protein
MVSPPTSSPETPAPLLGFRGLDGTPLVAPDEWAPAYVEVRVPVEDRHRVRVARNGSALPILLRVLDGSELIVAEWPRSGPGHYSLSLECPPIRTEQRLTITPKKITREAFAVLLDDLERRLPAAVALALQRAGALSGIKLLPPEELTHAQELQRLRRVVQGTTGRMGLAAVLAALAHDPHRVLRTVTVPVRAGDARRPDPLRRTLAIAQGRDLGASGLPEHVADLRVEHTVDVYENRVVRLLHDAVNRRLRRLARAVGRGRTGWSGRGPRPDPAIEVESPGERPRLYLLDPKYKLDSELPGEAAGASDGKPKKIDIDKMHTYRDAIRGDDLAAVVEHAAILYPGPRVAYPEDTGQAGPVIEAIPAMPGATPSVAAQVHPLLARALGLAEPGC